MRIILIFALLVVATAGEADWQPIIPDTPLVYTTFSKSSEKLLDARYLSFIKINTFGYSQRK